MYIHLYIFICIYIYLHIVCIGGASSTAYATGIAEHGSSSISDGVSNNYSSHIDVEQRDGEVEGDEGRKYCYSIFFSDNTTFSFDMLYFNGL